MSPLTRAIRDELLALLRSDAELRDELRRAIAVDNDELLTVAAAAQVADVHAETVRRRIRAGLLPAYFEGGGKRLRVKRADLAAHLEAGGRRAVEPDVEVVDTPERVAELEES